MIHCGIIIRKKEKMAEPKVYKTRPIIQKNIHEFDIIVPFHGQTEHLCRLIESINRSVIQPHHLCLVDDASINSHFGKIAAASKLHVIQNEQQIGFGASLMVGYNATTNPIVVVMHSDVVVNPGCINNMIESLLNLQNQKVGLVVAKTDKPGDGMDHLRGKRGDKSSDVILTEGFVPLYCAVFLRSLWKNIRGPIQPYFPAGYEDEELSYRMRRYGYKQAVCGSAWVQHDEGATITSLCKFNPEIKKKIEQNREFCLRDIQKLYSK